MKEKFTKGKFISFEGGEASGKTTQIKMLSEFLTNAGIDHIVTREPGGTKIGEKIREILLSKENEEMDPDAEILLFAATRAQLVNELILPNLEQGKMVISDRYIDSSYVYQGLGEAERIWDIFWLNQRTLSKCMPDITFYLDIDPEVAFKRRNGPDSNDRIETKTLEFHKKVRQEFLSLAEKCPDRIKVIDASQTVEEINSQIINIIKNYL